jgi:hypothetical protein
MGRRQRLPLLGVGNRGISGIDKECDDARCRQQLVQQLQSLPTQFGVQRGHACEIPARSVQAGNEPDLNRIGASDEDNGNRTGCSLGGYRRLAVCSNHGDLAANQIGRQCRQTIIMTLGPAVFDRDVPTLGIADFSQALPKRGQEMCILLGRPDIKKPNHRHAGCCAPAASGDAAAPPMTDMNSRRLMADRGSPIPRSRFPV